MTPRNAVARAVAAAILAVGTFLGGCATPPAEPVAMTRVILLPDEDGKVGAVTVSGAGESRALDQAYSYSTASSTSPAPSNARPTAPEALAAAYAELLKAQPPKPKTFTLHFLLGRTVLTEDSKAMLPEVLAAVRARKPTEITVFGHADAVGTREHNLALSAERARVVADWLRASDPSLERIDVQFFGDAEPLVDSNRRAPDPKNRRAEIMIL